MGRVSWYFEEFTSSTDVTESHIFLDGVVIGGEGADSALKLYADLVFFYPRDF